MTARISARPIDTGDSAALSGVRNLIAQAERTDGTPPFSDQALLASNRGRRQTIGFSRPDNAGSTSLLAVGIVGEGELDLVVRPDARGQGIGTAALEILLAQVRSQTAEEHSSLLTWAHGENPAARTLLTRHGFRAVRTLLRMALDPAGLQQAIDEARELPADFNLKTFDANVAAQPAEWVRVNARSFVEHPEQGAVTEQDFVSLTEQPWFDARDLILARETSSAKLAGFSWVKTSRDDATGETETELYVLGVDPEYSGRGLGAALLGAALQRMSQHRPSRITLYVEGDNVAALPLYHRAGFQTEQKSTQYRLSLLRE